MREKYDEINEEAIARLMEVFYNKIRADKRGLGEIFNAQIGTSDEEWDAHKRKIANFWQGMLLGSGDYKGQPLKTHLELPPFPRELFSHWLNLFSQSLESVFTKQEHTTMILARAQAIAKRFEQVIYDSNFRH